MQDFLQFLWCILIHHFRESVVQKNQIAALSLQFLHKFPRHRIKRRNEYVFDLNNCNEQLEQKTEITNSVSVFFTYICNLEVAKLQQKFVSLGRVMICEDYVRGALLCV